MPSTIKNKSSHSDNWSLHGDFVAQDGVLLIQSDTRRFAIGDGVTDLDHAKMYPSPDDWNEAQGNIDTSLVGVAAAAAHISAVTGAHTPAAVGLGNVNNVAQIRADFDYDPKETAVASDAVVISDSEAGGTPKMMTRANFLAGVATDAIQDADFSSNGLMERTGAGAYSSRAIGVSGSTSVPTRGDADARYLALSGGTLTGALELPSDPTNSLHAATKQYVDNNSQGIVVHEACDVVATTNLTLSGEQTIDGFTTSSSRVLAAGQSDPAENGPYVSSSGSWARASDVDTWDETLRATFFIENGTVYGGTTWVSQTQSGGTLGSTGITFALFGRSQVYSAGTGISLVGSTFSVTATGIVSGTYGNSSQIPSVTFNSRGQATAVDLVTAVVDWANITNKPTSGFGMTAAQQAKLDGIEDGATTTSMVQQLTYPFEAVTEEVVEATGSCTAVLFPETQSQMLLYNETGVPVIVAPGNEGIVADGAYFNSSTYVDFPIAANNIPASGSKFILSFFGSFDSPLPSDDHCILSSFSTNGMLELRKQGASGVDQLLTIRAYNSTNTVVLERRYDMSSISLGANHHFLFSVDLTQATPVTQFYLDDVAKNWETAYYTPVATSGGVFALPTTNIRVGGRSSVSQWNHKGNIRQFFLSIGDFLDMSVQENRRKFVGAGSIPVNMGVNGWKPLSKKPSLFLNGAGSAFNINRAPISWTAGTTSGTLSAPTLSLSGTSPAEWDCDGSPYFVVPAHDASSGEVGARWMIRQKGSKTLRTLRTRA